MRQCGVEGSLASTSRQAPSSFTMPLLDLPNELLLNVAESLREKGLNSFLQTNRRLASLLSPAFYKLAAQDKGKLNALLWATDRGHLRLVDLLLRNGADISVRHNDHHAFEAIHFAVHNGDLDMISLLLGRGSDIAVQDGLRSTPLHWAARRSFLLAVRLLLGKGAPLNARSTRRMTPLHLVTIFGSADLMDTMVKNMLDTGAGPSVPDHRGATSLHFLLRIGQGGGLKLFK